MYRQQVKQSLRMLKDTPLVSTVSIIGTALAIALVMVMVMLFQIKIAPYKPEVNKIRTLSTYSVRSEPRPGFEGTTTNSGVSLQFLEDHLYQMKTPEIVAATGYRHNTILSVPTRRLLSEYRIMPTDVNFWRLFQFSFTEGRPYTPEEYESGLPVAVINQDIAEALFQDQPAVGNTLFINHKPHTITGVVRNVSKAAVNAYSQVWVPITSNSDYLETDNEGTVGDLLAFYLIRKGDDERVVRNEFDDIIKRFSDNNRTYLVTGQLNNHIEAAFSASRAHDGIKQYLFEGILLILFLLLLPAINLTGIIINNVHQRSSEIAIRKTFGATKTTLMWQILTENLVIIIFGGVVGFALSFAFIHLGKDFLLARDTLLTVDMLLRPFTFLAALFFCFLLNLLSAGVPAWRIARSPIAESLNANEH